MNGVYKAHREGKGLVRDYRDTAVMGFWEVLLKGASIARNVRDCKADIAAWKPDVVILIDYPGFNLKIAEFAHEAGFKVYYYIAPKVWASREGRIRKIKAWVDRLFIIFPFEIPYFESKGVPFTYAGNPLVDAIDQSPAMTEPREAFFQRTGLPDTPYIALLAGSRNMEIGSMMPTFMQFADMMHSMEEYSGYQFVVAAAPGRTLSDYSRYIGGRDYVKVVSGRTYGVMKHAEAAVVNSGTASLECALIGTPQVVAYKGAAVNFFIAKSIIKIKYISLGNLILGRTCFRELLQYYFTPENVLAEVRRLLEDGWYRDRMLEGYSRIRESLGGTGASAAVAKAMIEELEK
jgi:lipid-A-disaccharide synthase